MRAIRRKNEAGISLLEVLFAVLLLAVGVLANMRFQRQAYREVGLASARVVASELATEKLDDLRAFSVLNTTTGRRAFQDIGNNTGGSIASGTVTVDNQVFTRSWTVVNWYYASTGAAATTTVPAGGGLPAMKEVTVTLSWTDLNNNAQSLSLSGVIAGTDPASITSLYQ
jgi:type IV pilus modification protein PilV